MKHLDWSLSTPEANLAADETLLDWCEAHAGTEPDVERLRFWMPDRPFVVVGYGQQPEREVNLEACRRLNVPVLRRCSGGGTVLQAPGCLNYTLILRIDPHGPTRSIASTSRFILERHRLALALACGLPPDRFQIQGHTDLTLDDRKFSGNAQRRRRACLLFHGTILLELPLALMEAVLPLPSRQPNYRQGRSHSEFLTSLPLTAGQVRLALLRAWDAFPPAPPPPQAWLERRIEARYRNDDWSPLSSSESATAHPLSSWPRPVPPV